MLGSMKRISVAHALSIGLALYLLSPVSPADGLVITEKPSKVDVIVTADNSGSMNAETISFQAEVVNLAAILSGAGLDYQIIAITEFGDNALESYCFPPPLGGASCVGLGVPSETATFKHYSTPIASHNVWCRLLETFTTGDSFGLHPTGWQALVRADARKVFIIVSDDGVNCFSTQNYNDSNTVMGGNDSAALFDAALLALSPAQFGTAADRNYIVHGILGMVGNMPNPTWLASDPIQLLECPTAVDNGTGHQALIRTTGGLRFPTCDDANYGAFLADVATDTIAAVGSSSGQYALPAGLPGGVDSSTFLLQLDPGDGGPLVIFGQDSGACTGETFVVSGGCIELCPMAESLVAAYTNPILTLLYADPASPVSCNGDGGVAPGCTNCPCGNNAPAGTIGGCLNSANTSARLISCGDTSVSLPPGIDTDLRFSLIGAPATAFCILTSGDAVAPLNPMNMCFGLDTGVQSLPYDGLRCAVQNTRRHGGRSADANGQVGITNNPWGGEGGPPVGLALAFGGFAMGDTRYFQAVNRDDALLVCMRGLNTSQAVEVTFSP